MNGPVQSVERQTECVKLCNRCAVNDDDIERWYRTADETCYTI